MGKYFSCALANAEYVKLTAYCKRAGATKSAVIQVLVSVYLDELIQDITFTEDDSCKHHGIGVVSEEIHDIPEAKNEDDFVTIPKKKGGI